MIAQHPMDATDNVAWYDWPVGVDACSDNCPEIDVPHCSDCGRQLSLFDTDPLCDFCTTRQRAERRRMNHKRSPGNRSLPVDINRRIMRCNRLELTQ